MDINRIDSLPTREQDISHDGAGVDPRPRRRDYIGPIGVMSWTKRLTPLP